MKILRPCVAEFLGTFYLCFPGIAAILATAKGVEPGAARSSVYRVAEGSDPRVCVGVSDQRLDERR